MTHEMQVDTSRMVLDTDICDPDLKENEILTRRAREARDYLHSFNWCHAVDKLWFAGGFSHVAVFFAHIDSIQYDKAIWVVVGDLPSAHLVVDDIPDFKEALMSYAYHMRKWVDAVKTGKNTKRLIPVNAPQTSEYAEMLESRLNFIEHEFVSSL